MSRRRRSRGGYYGGAAAGGAGGPAAGTAAGGSPTLAAPAPLSTPASGQRRWYKADLHTHTPASNDYEEPRISYLDWLRTAAERDLDIVAITDHNTVAGVDAIRQEIEWLTRLERQGRLTDEERASLAAWRELANKVLVLPGFEFTATFGFHIIGIFPPETSVRTLEHILLTLKVPPDKLAIGSTETGASTDVLSAYRIIREYGGLAIAAHANSTHGVAMRNFPFGGQTKIAYTQDVNLDALEVTDLDHRGFSTAKFFNGSKSEYPRRMHCLQGSDAHRLTMDPRNPKRLGVGERATELLLDEPSFEALAALLRSNQFDCTRPARAKDKPFDALAAALAEGPNAVQAFHESAAKAGGKLDAVLADICAFANTAGGSVYIGVSTRGDGHQGLARPHQVEELVLEAVGERLAPSLEVRPETVRSEASSVLRLRVPRGDDRPYALDAIKIYLRDEDRTRLAPRDEIVAMVLESHEQRPVGGEVAEAPDTPALPSLPAAPAAALPSAPARTPGRPPARTPARTPAVAAEVPADLQPEAAPAPEEAIDETPMPIKAPSTRSRGGRGRGKRGGASAAPQPVLNNGASDAPPEPQDEMSPETEGEPQVESLVEAIPVRAVAETLSLPIVEMSVPAPEPAPEPTPETAPKARRTRSKKAAPVVEAAPLPAAGSEDLLPTDTAPQSAVAEATPEEAAPVKPPARRSRAKSKPAAAEPAPQAALAPPALEPAPEPAAKPAARKRTTRAKAAAPAAPEPSAQPDNEVPPPQIGVEIVESEERNGVWHHSIRDLRNGNVVKGVTRRGARDLWNYAIRALEENKLDPDLGEWRGPIALLHAERRAGKQRYDLALRDANGVRIFYGVTADGMQGPWAQFLRDEE